MRIKYNGANIADSKGVIVNTGDVLELTENKLNNITTNKTTFINNEVMQNILVHSELVSPFNVSKVVKEADDSDVDDDSTEIETVSIPKPVYDRLLIVGLLGPECRTYNIGASDYSTHVIQPWSIWKDYDLDPWDADIIKRVLRTKGENPKLTKIEDYKKIKHICDEKIRQLSC